jgi:hypothetical protein
MKSDREFSELRRIVGSPLPVRIPFSLCVILINFQFLLYGCKEPPPTWVVVVFGVVYIAIVLPLVLKLGRLWRARGWFHGWAHPIVYERVGGWLLIWPTTDEPHWRRVFALVTVACVGVFSTAGFLRWGLTPS